MFPLSLEEQAAARPAATTAIAAMFRATMGRSRSFDSAAIFIGCS
jgi:hypothetical protein